MSSFGDYRVGKGFLTQQALADAAGVSPATIQRLEADPSWPLRSVTAVPVAAALGVEPDELRRVLANASEATAGRAA